eukprot:3873575-Prymnesium_polylepis.1
MLESSGAVETRSTTAPWRALPCAMSSPRTLSGVSSSASTRSRSRIFSSAISRNDAHSLHLTEPLPCFSTCEKRRRISPAICGTTPSSCSGLVPPSAPSIEKVLPEPVWPYAKRS